MTTKGGASIARHRQHSDNPTSIVIIEDDDLLLEMYATALSDPERRVYKAGDGAAGLKLIAEKKPRLVMLDLNMPSVSGFEVLEQLKAHRNPVPVIVVSNADEQSAIERCHALGAAEYLVKARTDLAAIQQLVAHYLKRTSTPGTT